MWKTHHFSEFGHIIVIANAGVQAPQCGQANDRPTVWGLESQPSGDNWGMVTMTLA
jgi:hypothetical protein